MGIEHCVHNGTETHCDLSVHAEANALITAARHGVSLAGAGLYCTHSPCNACAGLIINAGIRFVIYRNTYRLPCPQTLISANIPCVRWK